MSINPSYTLSSRGLYGYSPSERGMDWLRLLHIALTEGRFPTATVQAVQQAQVTLRFQLPRGAIQIAQNEWHPLLNNWLSEALFQNLREELGLVYAINNWLKADSLDWPVYSLVIASDVAPEQVEDYVAAVQSLLDALIQQPPNSATIQGWMQTIHADSANFIESTENQALLLARAEEFERPVSDVIKPFDPETTLTGQDLADLLAQFRNDPAILVQYIWWP